MSDMENLELFNKLVDVMDVDRIDKNRTVAHVSCPGCGKPPRDSKDRPANHFSFGDFNGRWFGHCFKCKHSTSLYRLLSGVMGDAVALSTKPRYRATVQPTQQLEKVRWHPYANQLVKSYAGNPRSQSMWSSYKSFSAESLVSLEFGLGILPYTMRFGHDDVVRHFIPMLTDGAYQTLVLDDDGNRLVKVDDSTLFAKLKRRPVQHQERLIVPVRSATGKVVALHGRSLNRSEKRYKWLACHGSDKKTPWGVGRIQSGDVVWVGENYVDAAMVDGEMSGVAYRGIGVGGVGLMRDDVLAWLKERNPSVAIVALDNDLAGQANEPTRTVLIKEEAKKRGITDSEVVAPMFGPRLANQLIDAGLNVRLFKWPDDAPAKAGLDWAHGV